MHYYEVIPNRIFRAGGDVLTYSSEIELETGTIVEVEVGKKPAIGLVLKEVNKPEYPTKAISRTIEDQPLPRGLVGTIQWISDYYATPLANVLQAALPRGISKQRRNKDTSKLLHKRTRTNIVFTPAQQSAIDSITTMSPGTTLLHGVTGSGKTAVYIELAKRTLEDDKSIIILVPEIALTPQLVAEFSNHFDDIVLTHSSQTEAERHLTWQNILNSDKPRIVIGPRSALFMPLRDLGLIVIDEFHEPSFKQEQSPRYSAIRVASLLAKSNDAKLILGSATPTVSDFYLAGQTGTQIMALPEPARPNFLKPNIKLVDMTKKSNFKKHRFLSDSLISRLSQEFESGHQALIFHNRRGSAPTTLCEECGWQAGCPRCFVPLTLHADKHNLRCHICGYTSKVPTMCPECGSTDIIHKGIGTKLIESELKKLFSDISIARFDGDNLAEESVDKRYSELYEGKIQLIIGTQVIAKGLDLPKLRTVGIVQADAGLSLPDYTAPERTFQLLAQVVGRVGRSEHQTNVIVQSYQPTHPAVVDGMNQNYTEFYNRTIKLRQRTNFPPFSFLLALVCTYKTEAVAIKNSKQLAKILSDNVSGIEILGPTPAFYERVRDTYRWQIVVKSKKRQKLIEALTYLPPSHWQYELDPASLL